jgi:hypothetical protein
MKPIPHKLHLRCSGITLTTISESRTRASASPHHSGTPSSVLCLHPRSLWSTTDTHNILFAWESLVEELYIKVRHKGPVVFLLWFHVYSVWVPLVCSCLFWFLNWRYFFDCINISSPANKLFLVVDSMIICMLGFIVIFLCHHLSLFFPLFRFKFFGCSEYAARCSFLCPCHELSDGICWIFCLVLNS